MKQDKRIENLQRIAALKRDSELAGLARAQGAVDRLRAGISALSASATFDPCVSLAAAERVSLRYEAWADVRRRSLNEELARQLAVLEEQKNTAKRAFGRVDVLRNLHGKKP